MYRAPSPYGQPPPRAPSPYGQLQRAPSPYGPAPPRSHSPQPPPQRVYPPQPAQPQPPASGDIVPGSVTYTTSISPDGRELYHPFKAVAASYQTPNGIVRGIQWLPAEATHILPQGAQPAPADFASWNRGNKDKDKLKEWQHEEDKRRKREEKEAAKRLRQQQEHRNEEQAREYERARRKSFSAGPPPADFAAYPGQSAAPSAGHPASPYQHYTEHTNSSYGAPYGRERKHSNAGGYDTLNRQLGDMNLNRERKVSGPGHPRPSPYGSQGSTNPYGASYTTPTAPGYAASGGKYSPNPSGATELPFIPPGVKYSPNPGRAAELPQFAASSGNSSYPGSAYSSTRGSDPIARSTSPYGAAPNSQQQVYPRGHILEGQPMLPRSRASSPIQGPPTGVSPYGQPYLDQTGRIGSHSPRPPPSPRMGGASPHVPGSTLPAIGQQLPPPEGFSRPINPNLSYAAFATTKIQAMEEFLLAPQPPRMPSALKSHDVYPEDWLRLMSDLRLAWSGNLPVPGDNRSGQPPRRTTLVADLVDLWNTSFFLPRGIEVALYKGRERRSGPRAGMIDRNLPEDDDSDKSESEDEDEDGESDLEEYLMRSAATYGPQPDFDPVIIARRRREAKEEKRRARREREAKRKAKAKEKEKAYALYVTYASSSGAVHTTGGMPGGYPPVTHTGYVPAAAPSVGGYGRHHGGY